MLKPLVANPEIKMLGVKFNFLVSKAEYFKNPKIFTFVPGETLL